VPPVLAVAAIAVALHPHAQGSRVWRPEHRSVVSDFSTVDALAVSESHLFVATPNGLAIYDRRFHRWDAPATVVDGYPTERVNAVLADPADESVWLATRNGLTKYRPAFRQFESMIVPGGVQELLYDGDDPFNGIYLRGRTGWAFLARGSFIPAPSRNLPPPGRRRGSMSVEAVLAAQPVADAMRASVLTDDRLRTYRYTSAARAPIVGDYYLGTDGFGVVHLDPLTAQLERVPFGLLDQGVGAVVTVPGGVWVGTDHRSRRSGFTFVDDDLQRFETVQGPRATGLGFNGVRALMAREHEVWAATDAGVVVFGPDGGTRRLGTSQGLPDRDTYALAQGPSGVWVGTAFGLAFFPAGGVGASAGQTRVPVLALSAARDTVWVGTTSGLAMAAPGSDLLVPTEVASNVDLTVAIVAVTHAADTVVAASIDRIVWRAPAGTWQVERLVSSDIGPIFALAGDRGGVWIGAQGGIAFYRFRQRDYQIFRAPADVPGSVRGLVVAGPYLWVATETGLVRFAREALLP